MLPVWAAGMVQCIFLCIFLHIQSFSLGAVVVHYTITEQAMTDILSY